MSGQLNDPPRIISITYDYHETMMVGLGDDSRLYYYSYSAKEWCKI